MTMTTEKASALRKPFPPSKRGQRPEITCRLCKWAQNGRCEHHGWINDCETCGTSHTTAAEHIDYVGHAQVTDRLNKVDPEWTWEPLATDDRGVPVLDGDGNLWILMTVCGVTRTELGDGSTMKDRVANAIRRGAMRFGVAIDLWAKSKHIEATMPRPEETDPPRQPRPRAADVIAAAGAAAATGETVTDITPAAAS